MNSKKTNLKPPTDEELKQMFHGIVKENRDHPPTAIRVKCGECQHILPNSMKCKLYPKGIPMEICKNKVACEAFQQKK